MGVLVVAAMRSELRAFVERTPAGLDVATGVLGIGTARARSGTDRLVAAHRPAHVVVIGVAGGIGPTTAVGDLVVPEAVVDAGTGAEHRPAPIPGLVARGVLHTSDDLVVDPSAIAALVERGVVALDMETAAVAAACERHGVPWSVARGISDHADTDPVDPAVIGLMGPDGAPRPTAVARYVARNPSRLAHLARLSRGLKAATAASADAAVEAVRHLLRT